MECIVLSLHLCGTLHYSLARGLTFEHQSLGARSPVIMSKVLPSGATRTSPWSVRTRSQPATSTPLIVPSTGDDDSLVCTRTCSPLQFKKNILFGRNVDEGYYFAKTFNHKCWQMHGVRSSGTVKLRHTSTICPKSLSFACSSCANALQSQCRNAWFKIIKTMHLIYINVYFQ